MQWMNETMFPKEGLRENRWKWQTNYPVSIQRILEDYFANDIGLDLIHQDPVH